MSISGISLALLANRTGLETTGEVLVGTREGDRAKFLFCSADPAPSRPAACAKYRLWPKQSTERKGFDVERFGDEQVLVAYQPVDYDRASDPPWGMIAKVSAQEADHSDDPIAEILWLVGVLLLLPALAAAYAYASCCARPIMRLADSAAELARGDFRRPRAGRHTR